MIEHVYEQAKKATLVHGVIVATDDARIFDAVRAFGGVALMTRADHISGTDRIAEVVSQHPCGIVVNLQGDEPLIEPRTIDAAVAPLLDDDSVAMGTLSRPFVDPGELANPNVVKVVTNQSGDALDFSRHPLEDAAAHIGLYVYRRETLLELAASPAGPREIEERLEQLRALANGIKIRVVRTTQTAAGVDTREDLERVRSIMMASSRN